jgi:hypothetical protein
MACAVIKVEVRGINILVELKRQMNCLNMTQAATGVSEIPFTCGIAK